MPTERSRRSRRRFLRGAAAALGAAAAGCSSDDPDGPGEASPAGSDGEAGAGSEGGDGATPTDGTDTPGGGTPGESATPTATPTPIHQEYETTEVRAVSADGEVLGSVTAAIADEPDTRYLGLSDTESLPEDRGMLFVFGGVAERTFVMREMSFGIDIVYADADGTITEIHHAPEPGPDEDGEDQEYPGRGQYVLEVNLDWTTDRGVSTGDLLEFEL